jgi:ParB/RepB/Spo0J family partition protein
MTDSQLIAQLIPIADIRPDPAQPRRLLPPDLQQAMVAGTSALDILTQLRNRAEHNKWIREQLTELDGLARSIDEDSLMNPIRVITDGDERYHIEEGERRWWAHHILVQQGKEQFQVIRAFVVEVSSASSGLLRRRVAENVLRSDFTALELARAMVSRIQEILDAEPGIKRSEVERRIGKENGMSDRRVRQFLALLTLTPEAQELAQQARLTENALRGIAGIKEPEKQLAAVRALLHPMQSKSNALSTEPASHRIPRRVLNRHSGPASRLSRNNALPSRRIRPLQNKTNNKERRNNKVNAMQTIQKVFALTKELGSKDWLNILQKETNRRALVRLHKTLGAILEKSNRVQREDYNN